MGRKRLEVSMSRVLTVRLREDEYQRVLEAAESRGVSLPVFVRWCLMLGVEGERVASVPEFSLTKEIDSSLRESAVSSVTPDGASVAPSESVVEVVLKAGEPVKVALEPAWAPPPA